MPCGVVEPVTPRGDAAELGELHAEVEGVQCPNELAAVEPAGPSDVYVAGEAERCA